MPYLSSEEEQAIIEPCPLPNFVETPYIQEITRRALTYLDQGIPVHLRGPTGTGKTTLAFHLAYKLGRPTVFLSGDEAYTSSNLVGGEHGYRYRYLRDKFVQSVLKVKESLHKRWIDNRLTLACKYGFTLIYDEFTRSRPGANNILLSVLEEEIMSLPLQREEEEFHYLEVHPNFTAIFTSNPEEYAGVQKAQDALRDRMITIDLDYFDRPTEVAITQAKSNISEQEAEKIVDLVREVRKNNLCDFPPTVRACITLAKVLKASKRKVSSQDPRFKKLAQDVLVSQTIRSPWSPKKERLEKLVRGLIQRYCY